jgi:hypothetical protein
MNPPGTTAKRTSPRWTCNYKIPLITACTSGRKAIDFSNSPNSVNYVYNTTISLRWHDAYEFMYIFFFKKMVSLCIQCDADVHIFSLKSDKKTFLYMIHSHIKVVHRSRYIILN